MFSFVCTMWVISRVEKNVSLCRSLTVCVFRSVQQCLGDIIIILALSILLSALDVFQAWTQCASKVEGWASKLLAGPHTVPALPFPPLRLCALDDDECRAVWPPHKRRPGLLELCRATHADLPRPRPRGHLISLESQNKTSLDDPSTDPFLLHGHI